MRPGVTTKETLSVAALTLSETRSTEMIRETLLEVEPIPSAIKSGETTTEILFVAALTLSGIEPIQMTTETPLVAGRTLLVTQIVDRHTSQEDYLK
jgi:hypothetical protein